MIMPELSGKEAYLKFREINPEVKVILSSGFKQDKRVRDVLELGITNFIQKPYTMKNLAKTVFEVIDDSK